VDELSRLIDATERGPPFQDMTGPARALCYGLAVATGLRFSEIARNKPGSFDWDAPSITVVSAYTKNGDPVTLPLPREARVDECSPQAGAD
jgi:integrase